MVVLSVAGLTLQDKQFCYRKSKSGVCPARLQTMQTFAYHLSTDLSLVNCHHVRSERPIKSWKGEFCLSSLKMVNSLCYSVWVLSLVCFTDFNTASCSNQHWQQRGKFDQVSCYSLQSRQCEPQSVSGWNCFDRCSPVEKLSD